MYKLAALLALLAAPLHAQAIERAIYEDPTERYGHGILGDAIEWGTLTLTFDDGSAERFVLPQDRVFEDVAPRLHDLDGDGAPEVIVVETQKSIGAQLAIYGPQGKITATRHIGTAFRWLAPIGAADFDGDGAVEIGYIDRPHLAKTLRVWRYEDRQLTEIAELAGLTNHRIGEPDIGGGVRDCGNGPEMITASANWRDLIAIRLNKAGELDARRIGKHRDRADFARALNCDPDLK